MTEARAQEREGAVLIHPLALALLALWLVNDHIGKPIFASWLTGKLSDVASLAVGPLLVLGAVELCHGARTARARRWVLAAAIATFAAVMISIKLFEPCAWAYRAGLGALQWPLQALAALMLAEPLPPLRAVRLAMDATDLLTLPSLWVAWWIGERT